MKKDLTDTPSRSETVVDAALTLAAEGPWGDVSLRAIADKAGIGMADLCALFADKADIMNAIGRRIDRLTLQNAGTVSLETPTRDRLFDVIMAHFDALNEYRPSLLSILSSLRTDPVQALIGLPHFGRSMLWIMEACGLQTAGMGGAVRLAGLTAVYLAALRVWIDDDSADMGKTMAALDKGLGRAEKIAGRFGV